MYECIICNIQTMIVTPSVIALTIYFSCARLTSGTPHLCSRFPVRITTSIHSRSSHCCISVLFMGVWARACVCVARGVGGIYGMLQCSGQHIVCRSLSLGILVQRLTTMTDFHDFLSPPIQMQGYCCKIALNYLHILFCSSCTVP
jgi:hypothetical protein